MGNFVGELYDVRSMVLAGFGFRLPEEGGKHGQHQKNRCIERDNMKIDILGIIFE
jgi:hypothetical protein